MGDSKTKFPSMKLKTYWDSVLGIKFTSMMFPFGQYLRNMSGIPWGFALSPFHRQDQLQRVRLRSLDDIARCSSCRGYINPYCNARKGYWKCSICEKENKYPQNSSRYREFSKFTLLPELQRRIVEYTIPAAENALPIVCCLVDVSIPDNIEIYKASLLALVESLAGDCLISLMTFSSTVGVYDLANPVTHIKNMNPLDDTNLVEEVVPLRSFFVRLGSNKANIIRAVNSLSAMQAAAVPLLGLAPNERKRAFGPCLRLLCECAEKVSKNGGRVLAFLGGSCTHGLGSGGGDDAKKFFGDLAEDLAGMGMATDLYMVQNSEVFADGGVDFGLDSLKLPARLTGGRVYLYEYDAQCALIPQDIVRRYSRNLVANCVLRVRTSPEIVVLHSYGRFMREERAKGILYIAGGDEMSTYYFDFDFNDIDGLETNANPTVQIVAMFSDLFQSEAQGAHGTHGTADSKIVPNEKRGEVVVRILTVQATVADTLAELYSSSDTSVILSLLALKIINAMMVDTVEDARTLLSNWVTFLLTSFNEHVDKGKTLQVQLRYPLEHVVRLAFVLLKSDLLNAVASPRDRCYAQELFMGLSPTEVIQNIYPNLTSFVTINALKSESLQLSSITFSTEDAPIFCLQTPRVIFIISRWKSNIEESLPDECQIRKWIEKSSSRCAYTPELVFLNGDDIHELNGTLGTYLHEDSNAFGGSFVQYLDFITNEVESQVKDYI